MQENKIKVRDLNEHIDMIGYQIPNPENLIKHMVAKLISEQKQSNDSKNIVYDIDIDVSKKYFLSPGDNN